MNLNLNLFFKYIVLQALCLGLASCITNDEPKGPTVEMTGPIAYVKVKKMDSIKSVAKKWKMKKSDLVSLNNIKGNSDFKKRPAVRVYIKNVGGGLSASRIQNVVRRNLNQLQKCYERLARKSPKKEGMMVLRIEIDISGSVNSVTYSQSSIKDIKLEECVAERVSGWRFPRLNGAEVVTLNYPINFKANYRPKKKMKS